MGFARVMFAVLVALVTVASVVALPTNGFTGMGAESSILKRDSLTEKGVSNRQRSSSVLTFNAQIMGNMSYLFGWQMAGSALSDDELDPTCNNITTTGHGRWANMGLYPEYIQAPICNMSHSDPSGSVAKPWTIYYKSQMLVAQLLSSFNNTEAFGYLCNDLRFDMLDAFYLDDTAVIGSMCDAAGKQLPPRPEGATIKVNPNAVAAVNATMSITYGFMYAASATSNSQLNILCAHAPEHISSLIAEGLDGNVVQSTLCNITEPLSAGEATNMLSVWSTRTFITVIENISNVGGYLGWLCINVNVGMMNAAGLVGAAVQQQICEDAAAQSS